MIVSVIFCLVYVLSLEFIVNCIAITTTTAVVKELHLF